MGFLISWPYGCRAWRGAAAQHAFQTKAMPFKSLQPTWTPLTCILPPSNSSLPNSLFVHVPYPLHDLGENHPRVTFAIVRLRAVLPRPFLEQCLQQLPPLQQVHDDVSLALLLVVLYMWIIAGGGVGERYREESESECIFVLGGVGWVRYWAKSRAHLLCSKHVRLA